ncbi:MAG: hypothetical protein CL887_04560 [Dehalococcoidia bacterium]|nr:hypothetical protein [Dehalococcoidia bacterium]
MEIRSTGFQDTGIITPRSLFLEMGQLMSLWNTDWPLTIPGKLIIQVPQLKSQSMGREWIKQFR